MIANSSYCRYIRLKRKSTTIFLHVEPSDNFQSVKQRAATILKTEPGQIGLFTTEDKAKELVDLATVGDQEVQTEQIIYMVFRKGEPFQLDSSLNLSLQFMLTAVQTLVWN
jgi:hypothetical protein